MNTHIILALLALINITSGQVLPGSGSFTSLGSFTIHNPLFRQSLQNVASAISIKHSDGFFFTDHTARGGHSKISCNMSDGHTHYHVPTHHELLDQNML